MSPKHNDIASEILLTPECKIQTGIKEEVVRTAPPLEQVIDEVCHFGITGALWSVVFKLLVLVICNLLEKENY